jgi:hypothetical protein
MTDEAERLNSPERKGRNMVWRLKMSVLAAMVMLLSAGAPALAGYELPTVTVKGIADLEAACQSMNSAGDAHGPYVVAKFVRNSGDWKSWSDPQDFLRLARLLEGQGDAVRAARVTVVETAAARWLGNADVAKAMPPALFRGLVETIRIDLTPDMRKTWSDRLKAAYAAPVAAGTMSGADLRDLAAAISVVDEKAAAALALACISDPAKQPNLIAADLAVLSWYAVPGTDRQTMTGVMTNLDKAWQASDAKTPLEVATVSQIARSWRMAGNAAKAEEWALRTYGARVGSETARQATDLPTLRQVADCVLQYAPPSAGRQYVGFSAALSQKIGQGAAIPAADASVYGAAMATPDAQQALRADLVDKQGRPNLAVARVLSWAALSSDTTTAWRTQADEQVTGASGDAKALWLVVRAYAQSVNSNGFNAVAGKPILDKALAAAATDGTRLTVLREIADYHRAMLSPGTAATIVASIKGQFGEKTVADVNALQAQLAGEEEARKADQKRGEATSELIRREARLQYFAEMLGLAKGNDAAESARLQAAVRDLKAELAQ